MTDNTPTPVVLSPVEMLALSRMFDKSTSLGKKARADVDAGEYEFNFDVNVKGTMVVGEDYPQRIVAKAQPWTLLMLLADKVNPAKLAKLVKQAAEIDKDDARVTKFKERVNTAVQEIKAPTSTDCRGKVNAKVIVMPVGKATLAA